MLPALIAGALLLATGVQASQASRPFVEFIQSAYNTRIYTYDLAGAGLQPALSSLAPGSPVCNACPQQNRKSYEGTDLCNFGLGKPVATSGASALHGHVWTNKDGGYSLAQHIHWRVLASKHHVAQPADATLFFIPAYVPHLCRARKYDPMIPCGVDFTAHQDFTQLWRWLLQQDSFRKSDGSDHFIILAKPWYSISKYCKLFRLDNYTSVEKADLRRKFDNMIKLVWEKNAPGGNVHPIPHSTSFHYVPDSLPQPLAGVVQAGPGTWQPELLTQHPRSMFAAYVGSSARGSTFKTPYWDVKRHTAALCAADESCFSWLFDSQEASTEALRAWPNLEEHARMLGFPRVQDYVDLVRVHTEFVYLMATFCLTPPGDAATRRGLFDALLLGCVPVVFFRQSADFPWHLPKAEVKQAVVFLPQSMPLENGKELSVMEFLRAIPPMQVKEMQQAVVKLIPRLQYSLSDMTTADHDKIGGDAWDITLAHMARLAADKKPS